MTLGTVKLFSSVHGHVWTGNGPRQQKRTTEPTRRFVDETRSASSTSSPGRIRRATATGGPTHATRVALLAVFGASVVAAAVVVIAAAGPVAGDHVSRTAASARVPVAAWGPVSGALGRDDPAYRAAAAGAGFVVRNPRQRLRAEFSRAGVSVRSGQALLGVRLSGYGYGGSLRGLAAVAPTASANRVLISPWVVE